MTGPDHHPTALDDLRRDRITARVEAAMVDIGDAPSRSRRFLAVRVSMAALALGATTVAGWAAAQQASPAATETASAQTIEIADLAEQAAAQASEPVGDRWAYLATRHLGSGRRQWEDRRWLAADGTGRSEHTPHDDEGRPGRTEVRGPSAPGTVLMGGLTPAEVRALDGDRWQTLATIQDHTDAVGPATSLVLSLIDLLAWPSVPGPTRANLFLILDDLGYAAQPGTEPGTVELTGPGPNVGDVVTLTIDEATAPVGYVIQDHTGREGTRSAVFLEAGLAEAPN